MGELIFVALADNPAGVLGVVICAAIIAVILFAGIEEESEDHHEHV